MIKHHLPECLSMKKPKLILVQNIMFLLLTSCATSSARNPSEASAKDFQDDKIAERVTAVLTPQIGTKNVGAIVAIYNKGSLEFLSFGETTLGNWPQEFL